MQQNCNEPGVHYNIPLVNALVLYVGTQAIQNIQNKGLRLNISTISHSSYMDIFQSLSVDLDTEGYINLNHIYIYMHIIFWCLDINNLAVNIIIFKIT